MWKHLINFLARQVKLKTTYSEAYNEIPKMDQTRTKFFGLTEPKSGLTKA